jgi:hypothetical protein
MSFSWSRALFNRVALLLPFLFAPGFAADPPGDTSAVVMREMQRRVETLNVSLATGDKPTQCTFIEKSLLRYSDPARETVDGTLWLWTHDDRPAALLCLFTIPTDWKSWNYEWTSFSDQPLQVSGRKWWEWTPAAAQPMWLPMADVPAASPTARLLQMKAIARRYTAQETINGEPFALRMLERPLYRYAAPRQGIIDGALIAYAYGTNPEIVMQIECRESDGGKRAWHVAFARTSSARVAVLERDKEIWSQPEVLSFEARKPYYAAFGPDAVEEESGR